MKMEPGGACSVAGVGTISGPSVSAVSRGNSAGLVVVDRGSEGSVLLLIGLCILA